MEVKEVELCYSSFFERFKEIHEFKKEHRNVKVLRKGHYIIEHGYDCKFSSYYTAVVQYED